MQPIVPVLAQDTIRLRPDIIYEFLGKGFIYTYQSVGTGTATIEVSNDRKNWVWLTILTNTDSAVVGHTWAYQRMLETDLTVTVHRGT